VKLPTVNNDALDYLAQRCSKLKNLAISRSNSTYVNALHSFVTSCSATLITLDVSQSACIDDLFLTLVGNHCKRLRHFISLQAAQPIVVVSTAAVTSMLRSLPRLVKMKLRNMKLVDDLIKDNDYLACEFVPFSLTRISLREIIISNIGFHNLLRFATRLTSLYVCTQRDPENFLVTLDRFTCAESIAVFCPNLEFLEADCIDRETIDELFFRIESLKFINKYYVRPSHL
jgi:hypothetical protein